MTALAPTLQAFFTDRLIRQRHASPHTIAAYRDTCGCCSASPPQRTGKPPSPARPRRPRRAADRRRSSTTSNTTAATASAPATPGWPRSTRCSATPRCATPSTPQSIARVLAIPPKRFDRALVTYLTEPEVDALLAAPDRATWTGRRDHALLLLAVQTGLRVSELTGLTRADLHLGTGAHVGCHGKGRKDRITPLTTGTPSPCCGPGSPNAAASPTDSAVPHPHAAGRSAATRSSAASPSTPPPPPQPARRCSDKTVTAHVLRHTAAMRLLHAGVDTTRHRALARPRAASRPRRSTCTPT